MAIGPSQFDPGVTIFPPYDPSGLLNFANEQFNAPGMLLSGQNLKRGALLGQITVGGRYTLSLAASGDGSQNPTAVLMNDCDASGGDAPCTIYLAGGFNASKVTFGAGHTLASVRDEAAQHNIFLYDDYGIQA